MTAPSMTCDVISCARSTRSETFGGNTISEIAISASIVSGTEFASQLVNNKCKGEEKDEVNPEDKARSLKTRPLKMFVGVLLLKLWLI